MIEDLTIRRFRGIEELELRGLGRLNLVIGPNGAAKTTLLQSVFALCLDSNSEGLVRLAKPEEDESDTEGLKRAFQWMVHRTSAIPEALASVEFTARVDGVSRNVKLALIEPKLRELEARGVGSSSQRVEGAARETKVDVQELDAVIARASLIAQLESNHGNEPTRIARVALVPTRGIVVQQDEQSPRVTALLIGAGSLSGFVPASVPALISTAESVGQLDRVVHFLRSFDGDILALRVGVGANNKPVARVIHRRLGLIPMALLGDGFVAAAQALLAILYTDVRVALLDEFDSRLHVGIVHRLIPLLVEVAREQDMQLFLTTHRQDTVEAVSALAETDLADARVIQMSRFENVIRGRVIGGDAVQRLTGELGLDLRQPA